ncbi:MAG TPA: ribose 5-phosphate isomerase B [Dehalococcoidia bacterium]|nr:ribose 5-phosphate isomerase B [Dehalococcoidia bacterium]
MRLAFGADHAGFALKQHLVKFAESLGHEVDDLGTRDTDSVDYPDFAEPVARSVVSGNADLGVVVCSNGVGVSITANKVRGGRCALCHTSWGAARARLHTGANVLALGAHEISTSMAEECLQAFLENEPEAGRHARRRAKISDVEARGAGNSAGG